MQQEEPYRDTATSRTACRGGAATVVPQHIRNVPLPSAATETTVDVAGCILWFGAQPFVVIATYLRPGEGLSEGNTARLRMLAALLRILGLPWLVFADWNMVPDMLVEWATAVRGHILVPQDVEATVVAGIGRFQQLLMAQLRTQTQLAPPKEKAA